MSLSEALPTTAIDTASEFTCPSATGNCKWRTCPKSIHSGQSGIRTRNPPFYFVSQLVPPNWTYGSWVSFLSPSGSRSLATVDDMKEVVLGVRRLRVAPTIRSDDGVRIDGEVELDELCFRKVELRLPETVRRNLLLQLAPEGILRDHGRQRYEVAAWNIGIARNILYCFVFEYLYSTPQQLWANRGAFGSISSN